MRIISKIAMATPAAWSKIIFNTSIGYPFRWMMSPMFDAQALHKSSDPTNMLEL